MAIVEYEEPTAAASDSYLCDLVREGSSAAFSLLYERHHAAARRYASRVGSRHRSDVDDVVEVAFLRVFQALQRGKGPREAFMPYLAVVIRREVWRTSDRRVREETSARQAAAVQAHPESLEAVDALERRTDDAGDSLVMRSFASLPDRWRNILWLTEVEGYSSSEVAGVFGLAPNAAAALLYRARKAFKHAFVAEYVKGRPEACHQAALAEIEHQDSSSGGERPAHLVAHLDGCDGCRELSRRVGDPGATIAALVPFGALSTGWWARAATSTPAKRSLAPALLRVAVLGAAVIMVAYGARGCSPGIADEVAGRSSTRSGPVAAAPSTVDLGVPPTPEPPAPTTTVPSTTTTSEPPPPTASPTTSAPVPSAPPTTTSAPRPAPGPTSLVTVELVAVALGDDGVRRPVPAVLVELVELAEGETHRGATDPAGSWSVDVRRGPVRLHVRIPLGYRLAAGGSSSDPGWADVEVTPAQDAARSTSEILLAPT